VLFHVKSKIPESLLDIEKDLGFRHKLASLSGWKMKQEKEIQEFMEKGRQLLLYRGVPDNVVRVKIQKKQEGIARDIVREAKRDYDSVVVGRWGLSKLEDLIFGSIASKLIGHLVKVPLWVVGGSPQTGKILLAMDASKEALRTVDYIGTMMSGSDSEVTLFHVVRAIDYLIQDAWETPKKPVEILLNIGMRRLKKAGLSDDQISSKVATGMTSRAKAIVEEAKKGGYGTIVVGRRGHSRVEEFFMGRVSNKVLQLAKKMAVWVVA
jgi:nucleotide-binding universal stress UspA family protein